MATHAMYFLSNFYHMTGLSKNDDDWRSPPSPPFKHPLEDPLKLEVPLKVSLKVLIEYPREIPS